MHFNCFVEQAVLELRSICAVILCGPINVAIQLAFFSDCKSSLIKLFILELKQVGAWERHVTYLSTSAGISTTLVHCVANR